MSEWKEGGREGRREGVGRRQSYLFLWFLESLAAGFPLAWEEPLFPSCSSSDIVVIACTRSSVTALLLLPLLHKPAAG